MLITMTVPNPCFSLGQLKRLLKRLQPLLLSVRNLNTLKVLSIYQVGEDPDVLAYDPGLKHLYVSAKSVTVTVFQMNNRKLDLLSSFEMPHAHTVALDPKTHLVYFPLENIDGRPILRIMQPVK
jgi:DNA-binding beta-propeller fold protein YncE